MTPPPPSRDRLLDTATDLFYSQGITATEVDQVAACTGESRLRAVVGGLHLLHADERRLDPTVAALDRSAPDRLVTCHCTGRRAEEVLKAAFPGRAVSGRSGMVIRFEDATGARPPGSRRRAPTP